MKNKRQPARTQSKTAAQSASKAPSKSSPKASSAIADSALGTESMTGFGRGRAENNGVAIEVEIRTWNSRFLDLAIKLPRLHLDYEFEIRAVVGEFLARGKVDVQVTRKVTESRSAEPEVHRDRIKAIDELFLGLGAELGIDVGKKRAELLKSLVMSREVVEFQESLADPAAERELLLDAVRSALGAVKAMRSSEGKRLGLDIMTRLENLRTIRVKIETLAIGTPERIRNRLAERLKKLPHDTQVDPQRLAVEVAMLAERSDVSEELTRLSSHFEEFRGFLTRTTSEGRKADFLCQELLREFNTINSKAQDAQVQHLVVEAKAEIEKMREQVQNIA